MVCLDKYELLKNNFYLRLNESVSKYMRFVFPTPSSSKTLFFKYLITNYYKLNEKSSKIIGPLQAQSAVKEGGPKSLILVGGHFFH